MLNWERNYAQRQRNSSQTREIARFRCCFVCPLSLFVTWRMHGGMAVCRTLVGMQFEGMACHARNTTVVCDTMQQYICGTHTVIAQALGLCRTNASLAHACRDVFCYLHVQHTTSVCLLQYQSLLESDKQVVSVGVGW